MPNIKRRWLILVVFSLCTWWFWVISWEWYHYKMHKSFCMGFEHSPMFECMPQINYLQIYFRLILPVLIGAVYLGFWKVKTKFSQHDKSGRDKN